MSLRQGNPQSMTLFHFILETGLSGVQTNAIIYHKKQQVITFALITRTKIEERIFREVEVTAKQFDCV